MARVMVFNGADWEPIDWDAPADSVVIDRALNGSTIIELEFPASYNAHLFKGYPYLFRGMAHVVVEDDDGYAYGGIIRESPLTDGLSVAAYGHSSYADNTPWQGPRTQWEGLDGVVAFRRVWEHIIDANDIPRMELRGATSGGMDIGTPAHPGWLDLTRRIAQAQQFVDRREERVAYWERLQRKYARQMFEASGRTAVGEVVLKNGRVELEDAGTNKAVIEYEGNSEYNIQAVSFWNWTGVGAGHWARRGTSEILDRARMWINAERSKERAADDYPTYEIRADDLREERDEKYPDGEADPYELNWWENRDLSDTLNEIAELGGFSWYDTGRWVGDQYHPGIEIVVGERPIRDDIHLELGVNIHEAPDINPQEVATHVTALGSGEGASTLRAQRRLYHDRLVPTHRTVSSKDYRTQQLVNQAADAEMSRSRKALTPQLEGLMITDHPMAPISSFRLGDRIRVVGRQADGSDMDALVRVTSIEQDLAGETLSVGVEGV
jgi:hypothetical protein